MYNSVVSSYVICRDNIMERTINEFSSSGVSPYVSYRQGGQRCLSLCKKTTAPALCYLCSLFSYVSRAKRHKGEQPLSLINKKAIAKNATA